MQSDFSPILQNIERYVTLSEEDRLSLEAIVETKKVKRRQFVEQPNFICTHQTYVLQGALRSYFISDDGLEHTIQFAVEDWFISDFNSYISQTPASLYVEAIEDSVIQQLSYAKTEQLCLERPVFERFFRLTTQRAFAYSQRRVLSRLGNTAEQRYLQFEATYPDIVKRVPQYMLASYLGMSAEFLSKTRKKLLHKS